jgi:uncharacterized protein YkwD
MIKYIKIIAILFIPFYFQPLQAQSTDKVGMEKAILNYVNAYRVEHHLQPLKMNTLMSKEAYLHSRDMAEHKMPFGHNDFSKRIQHCFKQFNLDRGPGAENVAYNYKTAKIVVDGWLHSRGHLANIRGNYNLTGIGIARDKQGKIYFTQLFMRV